MDTSLAFTPLIPWPALWVLAGITAVCLIFCLWRGLSGWALRTLAALVLLGALAEPNLQHEQREGLSDIVLVIVDRSESQTVSDRPEQTSHAVAALLEKIGGLENFTTKVVEVTNDVASKPDDGTNLVSALVRAANEVAQNRLAGAVLITDGQVHDADIPVAFPVPVHVF